MDSPDGPYGHSPEYILFYHRSIVVQSNMTMNNINWLFYQNCLFKALWK